jgi:glucose/arabinose dehydrogenase
MRTATFMLLAGSTLLLSCGGGGGGGGGGDQDPEPVFGLDSRPANSSCVAPERDTGDSGPAILAVTDAFPAAPAFSAPTKLLQAPGDGSRWFVLEKGGRIRTFTTANPGAVSTYLDFSSKVNTRSEGGMLGMAFHPDFPAVREVYVSYTGNPGGTMVSRISRVILDNATAPVNTTEQILLSITQPADNHNGGDIAFGDDGYLYIGIGDGGGSGDPNNHAQNLGRLLGKMLRIDVLGVDFPSPAYHIPPDNPHAGNPRCGPGDNDEPCPEIYAWGLRNPWRWSFDEPTGNLWAGDVGQGNWEEVDLIERGGNYGWRCREGAHNFNTAGCPGGLIDPVAEYSHSGGDASITGGYVYRGSAIPSLAGRYVFGDFNSGRIRALTGDSNGGYTSQVVLDTPYPISAFGLDQDGELYFTDYSGGRIRKLVLESGSGGAGVPDNLADTGCVNPANPRNLASGVIPYDLNAPFWSDGAMKSRGMALPNGARITLGAGGDWSFPPGTVLVKRFDLGGQPIETRLLMRHPDGVWAGYTYEWNDAGTAATRVVGGKVRPVGGQDWIYPSEGECMACHTTVAGFALGPETAQLNRDFRYPSTGRTASQLATLEHINLFTGVLPGDPAVS